MKRIFSALFISLVASQALATEVDDSLKKLESTMAVIGPVKDVFGAENRYQNLSRVKMLIADNNLNGAIEFLQNFPAGSNESIKAREELVLSLRKAQASQQKEAEAKFDAVLKRATEAIKTANTPSDLDGILQELGSLKNRRDSRRNSDEGSSMREKAEPVYRFVARWQDYLAAQESGNSEMSRNILRELLNNEVLLLPRSQILAKSENPLGDSAQLQRPPEEMADELIGKTKNLDGVADLINQLRRLNQQLDSRNMDRGNFRNRIQQLEQIDRNYREFQAGLATNIDIANRSTETFASIVPLKNQLLLLVAPRYISAPADLKPKAGESLLDYLTRTADEAKARGNVALAYRCREALRQMRQVSAWPQPDSQALSAFQAGLNQEDAGQHMLAVISYQNALKYGSDAVPAKLIGERLASIKQTHPEEYEKGMEHVLNPPAPRMPPNMTRFSGSPWIPGTPGVSPTPEAPRLVIPPAPADEKTPPKTKR